MARHNKNSIVLNSNPENLSLTDKISQYYNSNFNIFDKVFGNTIQVFQPLENKPWLSFIKNTINPKEGDDLLDAGCGNCIPAISLAKEVDCKIIGFTLSEKQIKESKANIESSNLTNRIQVRNADFHKANKIFPDQTFDKIYFLESIGHSNQKKELLKSMKSILKDNGTIYIQDLFYDHSFSSGAIEKIKSIEEQSHYFVEEIGDFLRMCHEEGFTPEICINLSSKFERNIQLKLEKLENQNDFNYSNLEQSYCCYIYGISLKKHSAN